MSDPFSIAGTVVSLVVLSGKLAVTATQFAQDLTSASENLDAVIKELQALCGVLSNLEQLLRAGTIGGGAQPMEVGQEVIPTALESDLALVLDSCMDMFIKLQVLLDRYSRKPGNGLLATGWKQVRWVLREKDLKNLRSGLAAHKATLNVTLVLASCIISSQVNASTNRLEVGNSDIIARLDRILQDHQEDLLSISDDTASGVILRRFLADTTSYAGSMYAGSVYAPSIAPPLPRTSLSPDPDEQSSLREFREEDELVDDDGDPGGSEIQIPFHSDVDLATSNATTETNIPVREEPPSIPTLFVHLGLDEQHLNLRSGGNLVEFAHVLQEVVSWAQTLASPELNWFTRPTFETNLDESFSLLLAKHKETELQLPVDGAVFVAKPGAPIAESLIRVPKDIGKVLFTTFFGLGFLTTRRGEPSFFKTHYSLSSRIRSYNFSDLARRFLECHLGHSIPTKQLSYEVVYVANTLESRGCHSVELGYDWTPWPEVPELDSTEIELVHPETNSLSEWDRVGQYSKNETIRTPRVSDVQWAFNLRMKEKLRFEKAQKLNGIFELDGNWTVTDLVSMLQNTQECNIGSMGPGVRSPLKILIETTPTFSIHYSCSAEVSKWYMGPQLERGPERFRVAFLRSSFVEATAKLLNIPNSTNSTDNRNVGRDRNFMALPLLSGLINLGLVSPLTFSKDIPDFRFDLYHDRYYTGTVSRIPDKSITRESLDEGVYQWTRLAKSLAGVLEPAQKVEVKSTGSVPKGLAQAEERAAHGISRPMPQRIPPNSLPGPPV